MSPRDIFSRAPSRAPSEIGVARTSDAQGSGSSTLDTIDQDASESNIETRAQDVANPGHVRTDSAVVRGLVGNAKGKVTGKETGVVVVRAVAPLTKSADERAKSQARGRTGCSEKAVVKTARSSGRARARLNAASRID